MAVEKHAPLYNAINEAITQFGHKNNIDARMYFAQRLRFMGKNGHIQLGSILNTTTYIPASPKPMNIDQMAIILHELDVTERQIILDAIAKEFGGVFTMDDVLAYTITPKHIQNEVMRVSTFVGKLNGTFLEYQDNDGVIDAKEAKDLNAIVYATKKQMQEIEAMLKALTVQEDE